MIKLKWDEAVTCTDYTSDAKVDRRRFSVVAGTLPAKFLRTDDVNVHGPPQTIAITGNWKAVPVADQPG